MKIYLISLAVGLLVGLIYGLLNVRSPAPPVIALVGLLGILLGEQVPSLIKHVAGSDSPVVTWARHQVGPHVFGELPRGRTTNDVDALASRTDAGGR
jgi:XapX domain-containing protein